ncbi:transcriptional regulator, TetR family [Desulfocicer vacuolatum DSM 3385]|uniref:Transcriptional regulator, TetR family n=1 Tax=Desulfocicer vacuolatum DSM 3385 TaxID=1121400 RepID=A0A1W2DIP9_9BACT|nr:TetR/AcrR family transcriptional regulator [Desulfocicer vacuolatum]SMC97315.1 transcriptional regulator, TetR family [Desulfocicer vacuolatum DSM 3385]
MTSDIQKPRTPTQKRGIKTKKKIVDAAMRVFSEKGFHTTNTKEIAKEAGISIGSFYAYFKDKKSVFLEIYKGFSHSPLSDIGKIAADSGGEQTAAEKVTTLLRALFDGHGLSPDFQREVSYMRYSDSDVQALHNTIHKNLHRQVVEALEAQKESLRITDIEAAAFVILCACEEVIHNSNITDHGMDSDRLLAGLADMLARFLYKNS